MRITKKMIRDTKSAMLRRVRELFCTTLDSGGLKKEFERCFPTKEQQNQRSGVLNDDYAMLDYLIRDLIVRAIPDHWCE